MSKINTIIEEQKKEWSKIQDLITVVSDTDILDTPDVEEFYRAEDRIINGSRIDNAWKALKMKDFYQQSIKQILEAEIERLKGMKRETKKEDFYYETEFTEGAYTFHKHRNDGYNQSLDDQITHLTNIIKEIK